MANAAVMPSRTRPSPFAAAVALAAIGVYTAWTGSVDDTESPWGLTGPVLQALWMATLIVPPWGLCLLMSLTTRQPGLPVTIRVLVDAAVWLLGTAASAFMFGVWFGERPDLTLVGLFGLYSVPVYLLALLTLIVTGPRRYPDVARYLSIVALAVSTLSLVARIVIDIRG